MPTLSGKDTELLGQACKRVAKLSTNALLDWADAAGTGMAKGFMDYRAHGEPDSLADISVGVLSMMAVIFELKARHFAEHPEENR